MERLSFGSLGYVLHMPQDLKQKNPAILFLHGAGTRGRDLDALARNPFFSENSCVTDDSAPFMIFAPQCHADTWFDLFEQLQAFAQMIASHPMVDADHLYLMGASMGGYATWQLAMTMPEYFAAIVPICGGGMYWNAARLQRLPVWAFHGKEDGVVFPEESIKMVNAVNHNGGSAKLTLLDHTAHDSWSYAYALPELFDWLLQQTNRKYNMQTENNWNNSKHFG